MDGTIADHVRWMRQRGLSERTVELRRMVLRLLTAHAGRLLLELTEDDLEAWQATLGMLALESRRAYVVQVRGYYRWAVQAKLLEHDPAECLVVPKVPRGLPRPMTEKDLEKALQRAPLRMRVWVELAAYGGARAAEIAGLSREDILDEPDPPAVVLHGKGGKVRVVPLAHRTLTDLQALGMPVRGRLFRAESGRPLTARDISKQVNHYLHNRVGTASTLHTLRHRYATRMYPATGHNLRQLQELLGHASPSTTAIYTQVDPSAAAEAVEAISHPLLRPVKEGE